MSEKWKPVPGFEGRYEVSDKGRVKSLARSIPQKNGRTRSCGEVILKAEVNKSGHRKVQLWSGHQVKHRKYVHRLVLEAFVGPCPDGMEACHWNDNPADNRLENLRWATQSDNTFDRVRNGEHHESRKTHCLRGHEFTPENTRPQSNGRGRECRKCQNLRDQARRRGMKLDDYIETLGVG